VISRGSLHFYLAQRKLFSAKGMGIASPSDFPYLSFVIIAKGKTLYLLVLYARVEQNTRAYEDNPLSGRIAEFWYQHLNYNEFGV
jgi:hypothetical protein